MDAMYSLEERWGKSEQAEGHGTWDVGQGGWDVEALKGDGVEVK